MSDPLSNSEIQDVLSSIRRLVSEDRRAREARAPVEAVDDAPAVGKLILTEALRVETVEVELAEEVEAEVEAEAAPEARLETGAVWPLQNGVRPASALADDIASLESTIAELEAAVAGIGTEFEPDGSEVGQAENDDAARQLEDAFDDGFAVDTGGPVHVEPLAEALDEPVTGRTVTPDGETGARDETQQFHRAPDEIAFLRSGNGARRPDWQVISGGEASLPAAPGPLGRLHLRPAGEAAPEMAMDQDADATDPLGREPEDGAADDVASQAVQHGALADDIETDELEAVEGAPVLVEDDGLDIPMDPDAEVVAAWDGAAAADGPVADTEASASDTPEPMAEDAYAALTEETPEVAIPDDLETTLLSAAAGMAGAAAGAPDEAVDEEVDLFSSGDEAVIDMEMLRELIVQVLREELQGPLGERITHNVRKLVRQEIARALEAQKFE